jgi:hypothetical protein
LNDRSVYVYSDLVFRGAYVDGAADAHELRSYPGETKLKERKDSNMTDGKLFGKPPVLRHGVNRWALFAAKKAAVGSLAVGSQAIGALAVGALAIGALAIGRLVLKRFVVGAAQIRSLDIDDLNVKRLRVGELVITDRFARPGHDSDRI